MCIHLLLSPAAADQSIRDGEDEGGAGEEEELLGTRGTQGEGLGELRDYQHQVYIVWFNQNVLIQMVKMF